MWSVVHVNFNIPYLFTDIYVHVHTYMLHVRMYVLAYIHTYVHYAVLVCLELTQHKLNVPLRLSHTIQLDWFKIADPYICTWTTFKTVPIL